MYTGPQARSTARNGSCLASHFQHRWQSTLNNLFSLTTPVYGGGSAALEIPGSQKCLHKCSLWRGHSCKVCLLKLVGQSLPPVTTSIYRIFLYLGIYPTCRLPFLQHISVLKTFNGTWSFWKSSISPPPGRRNIILWFFKYSPWEIINCYMSFRRSCANAKVNFFWGKSKTKIGICIEQ